MFELIFLGLLVYLAWALRDSRRRVTRLETQVSGLEAAILRGDKPAVAEPKAPELPALAPETVKALPPVESAVPIFTPPPAPPPPSSGPSLEERLGTRWTVWAGGLALAAGALLLVRYSIEQGLFGPGVRVMLGALLSLVLVGLGEWFRRSKVVLPIDAVPTAHIPSVLTAAGTVAAFGTVYAAHALYGFLGPASAFVLLGMVGVATMLAAALHGPALAGLGLAGAFVTPFLVSGPEPAFWPVVLYLSVVAAAAYGLARLRQWLWLAVAVVAGAVAWGLLMAHVASGVAVAMSPAMAHAIIQLALAAGFIAVEPHLDARDGDARLDRIATLSLGALTALIAVVLAATRTADAGWMLFAVGSTAILAATAWRSVPAAAAAVFAGVVVLAVAATWPDLRGPADARFLWPAVGELVRVPDLQRSYLMTLALLALGVAAVSALRLWNGASLRLLPACAYAIAAVVTPLAVLIHAYLRVTQFDRSIWFAGIAAVLAAIFFATTTRFSGRPLAADTELDASPIRLSLGAFAAGTMAAVALAFVFSLDRGYLTVAFAATAAVTAWIAVTHKIPALRAAIAVLGLIVLARVLWEPRIMGADGVGRVPILNWLLLGYGVPALAFAAAGHWLKRTRVDLAAQICDALGVIFAGLLGFYQIRHLLNGGDVLKPTSSHIEAGLMALMAILFAYALNRIELKRRNPVFAVAVMIFGVLAAVSTFAGLLLVENPFFNQTAVLGPPIASSLMLAYLIPGLAAVVFARNARTNGQRVYMTLGAILAIVLIFAYTTLETRHVFQGADIHWTRTTSSAEMWAYSAVWLMLGIVLLGYGVVRGSFEARVASGLLVLLATLKAFLFDLAGLTGIWRPLSFLCLGAVLIGIGIVYQRLMFAPRPAAPSIAPPTT